MASTVPSSTLLQSSLVKPIAAMLLVVFLVLLIISAIYFAFSYLGESSNECEELRVKEDKAATRKAFSVVAVVSVIGLIICGVVLRGARLNVDDVMVLRGARLKDDGGMVLRSGNKSAGDDKKAKKVTTHTLNPNTTHFTSEPPSEQPVTEEPQKSTQESPLPAEEPQKSTQESPLPAEEPQKPTQESPLPAEEPQKPTQESVPAEVPEVPAEEPPRPTQEPRNPAEIATSTEFAAQDNKKFSGEGLIGLYSSLPENAIIHCDLAVAGMFEECTVFEGQNKDLKGAGEADALASKIDAILEERSHFIAKCCRDEKKNTLMFTTMVKEQEPGRVSTGITLQECLDADCTDHVSAKIARNQLYQKVADLNFAGCEPHTESGKKLVTAEHIFIGNQGNVSVEELLVECPKQFDWNLKTPLNAAMLYKYTLSSLYQKFARVHKGFSSDNVYLQTRVNCEEEKDEEGCIHEVMTALNAIKN